MREYPDNHGGLFDGGDELQVAATIRTMFDIDRENTFEQARPTHARRCAGCVLGGVLDCILRWAQHDRSTQPGVGCQHAVEADQMQARTRHQGGQALHERVSIFMRRAMIFSSKPSRSARVGTRAS